MTVTLELKPEIEERIVAEAQASGLSVEEYIQLKLEGKSTTPDPNSIPYDEWLRRFNAWIQSHEYITAPPLSDEAMSRESIYGERDDKQL